MPACENVNALNAPTANNGISLSVMPPKAMRIAADRIAKTAAVVLTSPFPKAGDPFAAPLDAGPRGAAIRESGQQEPGAHRLTRFANCRRRSDRLRRPAALPNAKETDDYRSRDTRYERE